MKNTVHIDLERVLAPIDRNLFGGFAEHLGRCIYGGIYDPESPRADARGFRKDVIAALKRLRMPVLRYPGGNFVSGYRWQDGVGPREERPARLELAWHDVESNRFGTNEFIAFCRELGTEPYLVVNAGDGDMREARDWVEYCNGTADTALVRMRRAHGYPEPHNVTYWGIGNEVDGPWQIGYKTPEEYARTFTEFGKVMKWVDPDIKLLASANSYWHADFVERAQLLVEQAGKLIDYMAIHWYVGNREDDFNTFMATSELVEARLNAYEGLVDALSLAQKLPAPLPIAVDEWNVWYRSGGEDGLAEGYNLEDALVVALQLNAFIRHAKTVKMANLAQIVNVIAPIVTRPDDLLLQTIFYPFELYSRECGDVALDVHWGGDTFSGGEYDAVRVLDVAASLDAQGKRLVLFMVNRSREATDVELRLAQGGWQGEARALIVNGPDVKAMNTFAAPDTVGVREESLNLAEVKDTVELEPHSVTVLICPVQ